MTRWGLRIFVCLLLGALTTVGVAWRLEVVGPSTGEYVFDEGAVVGSEHERFILSRDWPAPPGPPDWYWTNRKFGSRFIVLYSQGAGGTLVAATWQTGWPMLALESRHDDAAPGEVGVVSVFGRDRPILPIPFGFVIDTCFYGALWTIPFLGFSFMSARIRRRRGRCPICAYDLRGDMDRGCPECGWNREP